jgi:hypothetical protein
LSELKEKRKLPNGLLTSMQKPTPAFVKFHLGEMTEAEMEKWNTRLARREKRKKEKAAMELAEKLEKAKAKAKKMQAEMEKIHETLALLDYQFRITSTGQIRLQIIKAGKLFDEQDLMVETTPFKSLVFDSPSKVNGSTATYAKAEYLSHTPFDATIVGNKIVTQTNLSLSVQGKVLVVGLHSLKAGGND